MMSLSKISQTVERWAARHPQREKPVLMTGMGFFSPRQLAEEVKAKTPTGRLFVKMIENSARRSSLDKILSAFEGKTELTTER